MSLFSKLYGTVTSFFQLGGPGGPGLANDGGSGNFGAYNSAQSTYINVRGADPVIANDFVTLEYGNANFGGGGSQVPQTTSTGGFTVSSNTQVLFFSNITLTGNLSVLGLLQGIH